MTYGKSTSCLAYAHTLKLFKYMFVTFNLFGFFVLCSKVDGPCMLRPWLGSRFRETMLVFSCLLPSLERTLNSGGDSEIPSIWTSSWADYCSSMTGDCSCWITFSISYFLFSTAYFASLFR